MGTIVKVVAGIVAIVVFLAIVGAVVFYLYMPSESNSNTSPINTVAPSSASPSVSIKFSLWEENGTAMPVESSSSANSGSGYSVVTTPLEFVYSTETGESYTFNIRNDGVAPINVNATVLTQNTPAGSEVSISSFYVLPELTPSTQGYVTVGVGQSTTVRFDTTLLPSGTNAAGSIAGLDGSLYSFTLELTASQAN